VDKDQNYLTASRDDISISTLSHIGGRDDSEDSSGGDKEKLKEKAKHSRRGGGEVHNDSDFHGVSIVVDAPK